MKRLLLLATLFAAPLAAQNRDSIAVAMRANQIARMIDGATPQVDTIFNAAFLQQVPAGQLTALSKQLAALGHVRQVKYVGVGPAPGTAQYRIETDKNYAIPMTLAVEATGARLVSGLFFGAPTMIANSVDDLLKEFAALPGHASVAITRVEGSRLVPIVSLDTARAYAIGSAFKLYVLAEIVRQIENGQRKWADVVSLDSSYRSLPSGFLQTWPAGTPMTLQSIATLMISISDNTAADHLLRIAGRENVERVQGSVGNTHAERNVPFLSTREMFALKTPAQAQTLASYIAGDAKARRAILESPAITKQRALPDFSKGPVAIESVEWFASTMDLGRLMVWLRDHSTSPATAATRGVLSVNKGIDWPTATWRYVGFKGGSEPGVINLTFLAERTDGVWFTVSASWNNPAAPVDETKFVGLVTSIRDLATKP